MSKIQKLPQKVIEAITPYLLTGEKIDKALLQDNKKPKEIWIIKTNQAIILHGQQPDKPQPAIMVMALDEIREIDYLQKNDDNQVIFYSTKNNGKAVFHFEKDAANEINNFFEDLGDLITFRYQTNIGKIQVAQLALPIGHKDRKVFGRGKAIEVPFLAKPKGTKTNESLPNPTNNSPEKNNLKTQISTTTTKSSESVRATPKDNITNNKSVPSKNLSIKDKEISSEKPAINKEVNHSNENKNTSQSISNQNQQSKPSIEKEVKSSNTETKSEKIQNKQDNISTKTSGISRNSLISHLQENPIPPKEEKPEDDSKKSKEIDFGNPVYFITVTIISTIVGFICLSFFKTISRVVKYFRKN